MYISVGNIRVSYQVIRVEKFSKGSLRLIGGETERTSRHHRNEDIDDTRTPLNYYYKKSDGGLSHQWKSIIESTHAAFKETKKSVAFEGMIITSDKSFFEKLGYVQGQPPPQKVIDFFNRSYQFVLQQIGYNLLFFNNSCFMIIPFTYHLVKCILKNPV